MILPDTDTRLLRAQINMTQTQFVKAYPGINLRTLQNWEYGAIKGDVARAYLMVIAAMPKDVRLVWSRMRKVPE